MKPISTMTQRAIVAGRIAAKISPVIFFMVVMNFGVACCRCVI
jgi:hypothetical protein